MWVLLQTLMSAADRDLIPIPIVFRFSFLNHDIDGKDVMRSFLYQLITWAYESQKQNRSFAVNLLGRFRPFFFVFVLHFQFFYLSLPF